MNRLFFTLILFTIHLGLHAEAASLRVLTTLPDLAEMVRTIGGDQVTVDSFLDGHEDAHFLDAAPYFVSKAMRADAVVAMGLELEAGWLPKVLSKTGKARIQPGGIGYKEVGPFVRVLEKPKTPIDRSMGHVHSQGNPHFNLSPCAMKEAAAGVKELLTALKPEAQAQFEEGTKKFIQEMTDLQAATKKQIDAAFKSSPLFMEYHKEFSYFWECYGLKTAGSIEELPGVPPSAAHLLKVAKQAQERKVVLALGSKTNSSRHLEKFTQMSGVPSVQVPVMVQAKDDALDTLTKLQNHLANILITKSPLKTP